jgi:NTP pyrophosphatase (non-canonical NTP hydrolase)
VSKRRKPFKTDVTPAKAERLNVLIEECGEVIQAATKILRHGSCSNGHNNRIALEHELGDLKWAVSLLVCHDDIWESTVDRFAAEKPGRAQPWLHHN